MVTMNYIQQIFKRNDWKYQIDGDGDLYTVVSGVEMYLVLGQESDITLFALVYGPDDSRGARTRGADVQTLVNALNQNLRYGRFIYSTKFAGVVFVVEANLSGGQQDDAIIAAAVVLSVDAAKLIGPLVAGMMQGRLTLQQVIQLLNQALREFQDRQRRRSA